MKERVISISILTFALVYLAGSISLSVGTIAQPGPGFMPAAIAFVLLLVAGMNVYKSFRTSIEPTDAKNAPFKFTPMGIAIILFIYPILLRPLGFILSTSAVLFILFRLMKFKSWYISLAAALAATLIAFYIFSNLLGVVLPGGTIEELILRL